MFRVPCRWLRSAPVLRRRLASFLLVLYIAALHGLPALHLAWHRDDHVHELGGLRWIRQLPPHAHAPGEVHPADEERQSAGAPRQGPQHHLRAAANGRAEAFALHLAVGPAHGHSALLAPLHQVSLAPTACSHSLILSLLAPRATELVGQPRARAPPSAL